MSPLIKNTLAYLSPIIVLVVFFLFAFSFEEEKHKLILAYLSVGSCALCLLAIVVGIALSFPDSAKQFRMFRNDTSISQSVWYSLATILSFALIVSTAISPRTNRIYYDEHIYQNIAQSITFLGRAQLCNYGDAEYSTYRPTEVEYNKEPNGYPYYLSVFFRLFGVSEWAAHLSTTIAYLCATAAMFFLVLLLFNCPLSALYACAAYAFTPMLVVWTGTTAAEPATSAFSILSLLTTCILIKSRSWSSIFLAAGTLGWAMQFRPESILLPLPVLLLIVCRVPRWYQDKRIFLFGALLTFLVCPLLLHLITVRYESWGSSGPKFALDYIQMNLPVNGLFYLTNIRFPLLFTLASLLGLIFGIGRLRERLVIFLWFLYSWGIFIVFYAGSYDYGADVRFSLVSAPPLAIFSGLGFGSCARFLRKKSGNSRLHCLVPIAFVFTVSSFLPLMRSLGEEAFQARFDIEYAREYAKLLPPNSIVLGHNPSVWLVFGKNAAQTSFATGAKDLVNRVFFAKYRGGVYYHRNAWCNYADPQQNSFCQTIEREYSLETIREDVVAGNRYGLYRMRVREKS